MLDVDGREHVDPGVEHVTDVLEALLVLGARGVRVRELVDQAQLGRARQHRRQVHLLERRAAVEQMPARDDVEPLGLRQRFRAPMRLEIADDDVATAVGFGDALLQHPIGLADAGRHPDEDLQVSFLVGHRRAYGTLPK